MGKYIAMLRGINVGTAKQVPMAKLKAVFENLGARGVQTVLRSGNAVFDADVAPAATSVEAELLRLTGVQASVLLLSAEEFAAIAEANPLGEIANSDSASAGSKLFVTFLSAPAGEIREPDAAAISPERFCLGERAVYQWFPEGSMQTKIPASFWKQFSGVVTARNANTVTKLLALLSD